MRGRPLGTKIMGSFVLSIFLLAALISAPRGISHIRSQLLPVLLLKADKVERIELLQLDEEDRKGLTRAPGAQPQEITDSDAIAAIVTALWSISPYSPNHEGIRRPWLLVATTRDGRRIMAMLGRSSNPSRSIGWVEFRMSKVGMSGSFQYQNPKILEVLEELGYDLQEEDPAVTSRQPDPGSAPGSFSD